MPPEALALVLGAAVLHALWNLLVAGATDPQAATALMLLIGTAAFAPVAAATWDVEWRAAPYVVGSAALELVYFALLAVAYARSELSLVYPIARGLAPVIVLVLSVTFLSAAVSTMSVVGIALVAAGVLLVRGLRGRADPRGFVLGVLIAACIAGYTLVDKEGLRYAGPVAYIEIVSLGFGPVYAAVIAARRGVAALRSEFRPRIVIAGLATVGAYALVLAALDRAPAAPVAAVRESSVLLATALAAVTLRERVGPARLIGAAAVVAGIVLIGLT
jgi:drug/metabolite transporter (DMT)-like permease